jgi:hypothetical protein
MYSITFYEGLLMVNVLKNKIKIGLMEDPCEL